MFTSCYKHIRKCPILMLGNAEGWNHASEIFNVILELVKWGYTEEEISKLWSGNLLCVLGEVAKVANELN